MPKVTKKKKEKDADFKKAKLKLGKGKQTPNNATDTSYKARSIALPSQNPLARALITGETDLSAEPTTSRGLKLTEVLLTLRHPNAGVRKDGLGALKEVLVAGAEMGVGIGKREGETGKVIAGVVRLLGDDDVQVRKGLLAFLAWYLPLCPTQALPPHLPLLLLQTSSALSHIFPEIRLEACRLVRLLLSLCPDQVVNFWPFQSTSTILEGLRLAVGLGGKKGEGGQTGVSLLPASKLITLQAMLEFIQHALGTDEKADMVIEGWLEPDPLKPARAMERNVVEEDKLESGWLAGTGIGAWGLESLGGAGEAAWEVGRLDGAGAESGEAGQDDVDNVLCSMYLALHPLLISTFLEQAPTAFNVSQISFSSTPTVSQDVPIALCSVSVELCATLARAILSRPPTPQHSEIRANVSDFVRRMTAWFPFQLLNGELGLSLGYAHLAVLLAPPPPLLPVRIEPRLRARVVERAWETMRAERAKSAKGKGKGRADEWALGEVAEWVAGVLTPSTNALAAPLSTAAYIAILPLIWTLVTQPPPNKGSEEPDIPTTVALAFTSHLARQSANSPLRKHGDAFMARLILVHEAPHPLRPFYIQQTSPVRDALKEWFAGLPKILWERGAKDEGASEALLRFLLEVARRGEKGISFFNHETWTGIPQRLAPFFSLQHPTRGLVLGPYTKLAQPQVQTLARHVAIAWSSWDETKALRIAVART